jgi:hypothetical protein
MMEELEYSKKSRLRAWVYLGLEEHGFPKMDISVPFAISLPLFSFRSDPQLRAREAQLGGTQSADYSLSQVLPSLSAWPVD